MLVPTLVACGDDTGDSGDSTTQEIVAVDSTTTTPAPAFPVTVGELTLESEPQRIVSMSATATEMLFAIGAGDKVVAIDNFSNYPAETSALEKVDATSPTSRPSLVSRQTSSSSVTTRATWSSS